MTGSVKVTPGAAETSYVDPMRCASCGASLAADAPWCSLCLAPRPAPVLATAAAGRLATAPPSAPAALPLAPDCRPPAAPATRDLPPAPPPAESAPSGRHARPEPTNPPPPEPRWPCLHCGASAPMTAEACPACGAAFLAGAATAVPSLRIPVLGLTLAGRGRASIYLGAGVAGLLLAGLLIGLVTAIGAIF